MKPEPGRFGRTVKRAATQVAQVVQDVARFVDRHYVLARGGEFLYKSVKRRMGQFVFLATTFFIGGKAVAGQEVHLSHVGALVTLAGLAAYGFQWWANKVLHRNIDYAQSHGANLLEDRKKAHFIKKLGALWEAVYAPEAAVLFSEARRCAAAAKIARIQRAISEKHRQEMLPGCGAGDSGEVVRFELGRVLSNSAEQYALLDKAGFCAAVEYELRTFHPQNVQAKRLGFSISQLEDLLDGATLTRNDTKILEQRAHAELQEIAACIDSRLPRWRYAAQQIQGAWLRYCQTFWQYNIALSVEASVGSLLSKLHDKYETGHIDAQDIIWQDEEALSCLAPEIVREIRFETRKMIRRIFSRHTEHARRLVVRMYGYNVRHGVHLLMSYDGQYVRGRLARNPAGDMGIIAADDKELEKIKSAMDTASQDMKRFYEFTDLHPDVMRPYDDEARRAIETAYYTNYNNLRQKIFPGNTACEQAGDDMTGLFTKIAERKSVFTHRLRVLRLHKALAILEFEDVLEHIQHLGDLTERT